MARERINPENVFKAPFAHAIRTDNTVWMAGEIGIRPDGSVAGDDARSQATQAFENIKRILADAGGTMDDIVQMRIYVTDIDDVKLVQEARTPFITDVPPGTILVVKSLAAPFLKVELEAVAVLENA